MALNGIHHLTSLTADMDRLIGFYERVFDARTTLDLTEDGLRHAFIELGPNTVLHPFQVPGGDVPQGDVPMFARGRIDHFGVNAASEGAGVDDAVVSDMGSLLSFTYEDPDGVRSEVVWEKPGVPRSAALPRDEWKTLQQRPA